MAYPYSYPGFGGSAIQLGVGKPIAASWPSTTSTSSATVVAPPPPNLDANSGAFAITGYAAGMSIGVPLGSGSFHISSGAPASPAVTWDPSNMDAGVDLSGGNLTVSTTVSINKLVRATASNTAGYFEQVFSSLTAGSGSSGIGFMNASETFANHYLGHSGGNSIGYYPDGTVFFNGVALATGLPTFAAGDALGAELTAVPSIKFYKNGALVYTSTSVPAGSLYPGLNVANNGDIGTASFGAKLQTYLPSGVTAWDGSQAGTLAGMGINLAAGSGSFAITGYGASLIRTGKLAAGSGAFAITGNSAGMSVGLPAGSGAFAYTGYATGELVGEPAGFGSFAITGYSAANAVGMPLGSGSFAITGNPASLVAVTSHITWNPADAAAGIAFTAGNLTATFAAGGSDKVVRATAWRSAGRSFEVTATAITVSTHNAGVGLANSSASLTSYLGSDNTNAIGWFADGWVQGPGGVGGHLAPTFATGDVLTVELLASSIKLFKNGTLAFTFSTLPTGNLYPAISLHNAGDSFTGNFGATPLSYLPADAVSWDGTQPVLSSGSFVITGGTLSFKAAMPLGAGAFAITGGDASLVPSGASPIMTLGGDPITETAIVAASLLMFRRKYPLSAQPKNTARSLEVPFDALIRREEPDFARERRRQPEYDFTNHTFEADPSNRGAYEAH